MKKSKRMLALLLCALMIVTMLPVSALAAEDEGLDAAVPEQEEEILTTEPVEEPEQELVPETPAEPETPDEPETPAEPETPEEPEIPVEPEAPETPEPVVVNFVLTPEDAEVTVYTKDENGDKQEIEAEEDGSYRLLPGVYFYTAVCEGYETAEDVELTVEAVTEPVEVAVELSVQLIIEDDERITKESELFLSTDANTYVINGVSVSNTDFPSEPNECWAYAQNMYQKIWSQGFSNSFYSSDNLLRNLSDSELTLTAEHLKAYVSQAALGACLRICNSEYLRVDSDGWGHSQIIVQKDANGFTVFEGGLSASPYRQEKYYTWSSYLTSYKYAYIKYIKWPGTHTFTSNTYTVTFNANGGTCSPSSISVEKGKAIGTLPTPTLSNPQDYRFMGWYTAKTGGTEVTSSTTVNSDMTIYAHWVHIYQKITFDLNGGTWARLGGKEASSYSYTDYETGVTTNYSSYAAMLGNNKYVYAGVGGYYEELPVPTKSGSYFAGWYIDGTSIRAAYNTGYGGPNLTAHWSTDPYPSKTMTYDGHQYELYDYNMTWTQAKALCESKGGHLVTITSAAEQAKIEELMSGCILGNYFIGATDAETEGTWKWISGESFSYEHWDATLPEPNGGTEENYSTIIGIDNPPNKQIGEWCDSNGAYAADYWGGFYAPSNTGFICEYESSNLASGTCGDNLTWVLDEDGVLTISGTGDMYHFSIIGSQPWYDERELIKEVHIGSGATSIGRDAFCQCSNLQTVTIPYGVTFVGMCAFEGCAQLTDLTLPGSVQWIENQAFEETGLTSIVIPYGVTSIGLSAFGSCHSLKNVAIPESVTEIGDSAFIGCTSLDHVSLPSNLVSIGAAAFCSCWSLSTIRIPDSVTGIGESMFEHCFRLESITIPESVTSIESYAFNGCIKLAHVYYSGTKYDWNKISIASYNDPLLNATLHCKAGFSDVTDPSAYFYTPVYWAVEKGITTGTTPTTFSPNNGCTRGQIVTFLWRAKGCPEPTVANPFKDIKATDFYYKAVLWAYENEITTGTTATTFSPGNLCTREQCVTFLWRAAGKPAAGGSAGFTDVISGKFYEEAVSWAYNNGVTTGITPTTFGVGRTCTRGQIVTFIYRYMNG